MSNADAENILKFYSTIDANIALNKKWIKDLETQYDTIGAIRYDRIGGGGGPSDTTARAGGELAEEGVGQQIQQLNNQITELRNLRSEILKELMIMEPKNKAVLYGHYVRREKWERIAEQTGYSVRQCQNIKHIALQKFAEQAGKNKTIKNSLTTYCIF